MTGTALTALLWSVPLLLVLPTGAAAQQQMASVDSVSRRIRIGTKAPDFTLLDSHWKPVRLSSFRGRSSVILVFHVVAFSPHCAIELRAYQRELAARGAGTPVVLGINMDSPYGNGAFAKQIGVTFPLLSDMRATVLRDYSVTMRESHVGTYTYQWPEHTTILIDKEGIVRYVATGNAAMDPSHVFGRVETHVSGTN